MDGIQKSIYLALYELATSVEEGKYGKGDDFDAGALEEDIESQVMMLTV